MADDPEGRKSNQEDEDEEENMMDLPPIPTEPKEGMSVKSSDYDNMYFANEELDTDEEALRESEDTDSAMKSVLAEEEEEEELEKSAMGEEGEEEEEEEEEEEGTESIASERPGSEDLADIPLDKLTLEQLEMLVDRKENELAKCRERVVKLRMEKEWQEMKKKRTIKEEEILQDTIQLLKEEETYLLALTQRLLVIKKAMQAPETYKKRNVTPSKLPQVILCSKWEDSKLPKVVVCSTPRNGKMKSLTREFLKVLSPQQLEIIEKEKQWMAVECGKVRLEIAGVKGKLRMLTKENEELKTLIDTTSIENEKEVNVIMPDDLPCAGPEGIDGRAGPCTKMIPPPSAQVPPLEMTISAMAFTPRKVTLGEEIENIAKMIQCLQKDLDKAIEDRGKLEQQRLELMEMKALLEKENGGGKK